MTLHTRQSGAWAKVNGLFIRQSGVWTPVKNAYVRDGGVWKVYYSSEIVVQVAGTVNTVTLKDLFTSADWTAETPKRVVIAEGAVVNGASWGAIAAQQTGPATDATWGGTLTLDNYGTIQGIGGSANSGVGGQALHDNAGTAFTKKVIVNNYGIIRAGGGGGGKGGAGSITATAREPAEGFTYNAATHVWTYNSSNGNVSVTWGGVLVYRQQGSTSQTSVAANGYSYFRGFSQLTNVWSVARQGPVTTPTTGGDGGRGQGSDGAAAVGAVGGTNAGTGGAGGDWGADGSTGAAGNVGAGSSGGIAGIAYSTANFTVNNSGTIQGRVL